MYTAVLSYGRCCQKFCLGGARLRYPRRQYLFGNTRCLCVFCRDGRKAAQRTKIGTPSSLVQVKEHHACSRHTRLEVRYHS